MATISSNSPRRRLDAAPAAPVETPFTAPETAPIQPPQPEPAPAPVEVVTTQTEPVQMIRLKNKLATLLRYTLNDLNAKPGDPVTEFPVDGYAVSEAFDKSRLTSYTQGLIHSGHFVIVK